MKWNSKALLKTAVFVGLLAAAGSARAAFQPLGGAYVQGDLIVGFTVGSGNDLVVNLDLASSALISGNQWDLSTLLASFNSGSLDGVNWGVIGVSTGPNKVYSAQLATANTFQSLTAFNQINTAMNGFAADFNGTTGSGTPPANSTGDGSWYSGTVVGGSGTFKSAYGITDGDTTSGLPNTLKFFTVTQGTSHTNIVQTGTFTLSSSGILTFSTVVASTPPPPQITSITRAGNTSTVSFTTTNGSFTYSLFYTNSTGLTSPLNTWPASTSTVTGNGSVNMISDTTADTNRFYTVGVH